MALFTVASVESKPTNHRKIHLAMLQIKARIARGETEVSLDGYHYGYYQRIYTQGIGIVCNQSNPSMRMALEQVFLQHGILVSEFDKAHVAAHEGQ